MRFADFIYALGGVWSRIPKVLPIKKIKQLFISGFYGATFASCGKRFRISSPINCIHPFVRLEAIVILNTPPPTIVIGNRCGLGYNTQINASNRIVIGDDVLFASNVYITDHYHGDMTIGELDTPPSQRKIYSKGPVVIGDKCWLGQDVSIMPNVTLGAGCVVGANSVVTHSFPANSVIAGCPAKLIRIIEK